MTILFDLDGTLLDTSFDIHDALNLLLLEEGRAAVPYAELRPLISFGSIRMLEYAFKAAREDVIKLQPRFLELYRQTNFQRTTAFPGIDSMLLALEDMHISWGIVTNKIKSLTEPLLQATGYFKRSSCVVCGDTTSKSKPHPEPLYYACDLLKITPQQCLYVGDSATDIQAGKAAGMATMAVAFGYIPTGVSIHDWQADYIATTATEILPWVKKWSKQQS